MSRFYGTFDSDCTKTSTKRGHNYVEATLNGWEFGVNSYIHECHICGADKVTVYLTAGSDNHGGKTLIFQRCAANCQK